MSPRLWEHRVADTFDAIRKIQDYVKGMNFVEFQSDPKTVDAVIRNFIVIGEAARSVPKEITDKYPRLPWRLMGDMRKFAIHEYWGGGGIRDNMGDHQKGSSPFGSNVGRCPEGRRWRLI